MNFAELHKDLTVRHDGRVTKVHWRLGSIAHQPAILEPSWRPINLTKYVSRFEPNPLPSCRSLTFWCNFMLVKTKFIFSIDLFLVFTLFLLLSGVVEVARGRALPRPARTRTRTRRRNARQVPVAEVP